MAPHGFRVVFLDLMPRLYTLRALIISSLFIVSININWTLWLSVKPLRQGLWVFLYALIATHHTIRYRINCLTLRTLLTFSAIHSAFNWPILYGGLELPLIIVELVGLSLLHGCKKDILYNWHTYFVVCRNGILRSKSTNTDMGSGDTRISRTVPFRP